MPDRRSLEGSATSQHLKRGFRGLVGIMFACGLICALAFAIPLFAQTSAAPASGEKKPSGEGAAPVSAGSSKSAGGTAKSATSGKKSKKAEKSDTESGANPLSFSTEHGPIDIRSDALDLDYKAHTVFYRGQVHATQGTSSLTSDTLQVLYNGDFKDLKQAIATGNVHVSQGGRWATSDRAELDQVNHTVIMTGNPVMHDGPDQVAGTRILIYLDTNKSVVEKAHAILYPNKSQGGEDHKPNDHEH